MEHLFNKLKKNPNAIATLSMNSAKKDAETWGKLAANPNLLAAKHAENVIVKLSPNDIGSMLCFSYNSNDQAPIIFLIELYPNGMLGLNLHYLPPQLRVEVMNQLSNTINVTGDKLKANYKLLKQLSKFPKIKHCIKRYNFNNVKSKISKIPVEHWDKALFTPFKNYKNKPESQVHQETIKKINKDANINV